MASGSAPLADPSSPRGSPQQGSAEQGSPSKGSPSKGSERAMPLVRWLKPRLLLLTLLLVVVLVGAAILWRHVFISIQPGEGGVLFRLFTGMQLDRTYGEGLHIIPPWDRMIRYELRKQIALHSFEVLSVRALPVRMELAIRYSPDPELLPLLHQRIGPDYARRVVVPQTESVLRRELSLRTAEEIYTNAGGLLNAAILLARDEVGRNFVDADDIVIRTLQLPDPVRAAIEDKQIQEAKLKAYVFRLRTAEEEAERKRDEARGIRDYQATVDATLSDRLLRHEAILATKELATASNSRVVILGAAEGGLPVIPGAPLPLPSAK